ncbi:XdhC family protein [Brevibacillus ruminantium]|uniref:XdhC family protein n=1 Tax=Brevibacillus ruminantium TaxID=2950604 RepID=A0ABY4WDK7_9BACL|nr:XdhC/CoxI family protein [Brevibacillus ruminantium]USG63364.1 XdhC family protein [Brevibacillus ruminantium]
MKDHLVFNHLREVAATQRQYALATVVRVKGSAYRREGAKMLIDEEGTYTGMISGGCLEADVAEVAKEVMTKGRPRLKTYVMDEELVWGLGLGCPGTVELLIEPLTPELVRWWQTGDGGQSNEKATDYEEGLDAFQAFVRAVSREQACLLFSRLDLNIDPHAASPRRLFLSECGDMAGSLGDSALDMQALAKAKEVFQQQNPKPGTICFSQIDGEEAAIFVDLYIPPIELVIFGAGHDALPLAQASVSMGFRTTVVDPRPGYNTAERFPGTIRILTDDKQQFAPLKIGNRSYVVIMNHHLERDQEALRFCLQTDAPYIGVLGPRTRCQRMLDAIREESASLPSAPFLRLHNPVGLDIGADSPEEIALSIIAEVVAVRNGHTGHFLRGKERIHQSLRTHSDLLKKRA